MFCEKVGGLEIETFERVVLVVVGKVSPYRGLMQVNKGYCYNSTHSDGKSSGTVQ